MLSALLLSNVCSLYLKSFILEMGDLINYIYVLYGFIQLKESTVTHDDIFEISYGFDKFPLIFIALTNCTNPMIRL